MNPFDQFVSQYKQGYKTSEFWIVIAVGLTQALAAAFDKSQPLNHQLSNLTWVAISYVLARAGLKVARTTAQARVVAATTPVAQLQDAVTAAVTAVSNGSPDTSDTLAPMSAPTDGSTGPNDAIDRQRMLDLVESAAEALDQPPPASL